MIRQPTRTGVPAAVVLCLGLAATAAFADGPTLALSDFSLKFLSLTQAHVKGTVTCQGLKWPDFDGPQTNDLEVGIEVAYPGKTFPVLVDWGDSQSYGRNTPRVYTAYSGDQKIAPGTPYRTMAAGLTPLEVMDHLLYYAGQERVGSPGDDGRPFSFDKTMDFSLLGKPPERYRVLVRLEQSCQTGYAHSQHPFVWIVYGPFRWGQAPPLPGPLTAGVRKQAHFTGGSTATGVTTGPGGATGTGGTAASAGALSSGPSSATGMRLVIGGKPYTGPAPRVIKGATMVPMMPFFQASPIGMSYDRATRRLIVLGRKTVVMWVGKTTATVDGARVPLATPPVLVGSEVYIPLRFTVETIGGELKWDAASKTMGVAFPAPQF